MIFSLIGLSTTVLMVAEAFMMATPGLNPIWGYLIVIGPVAVFAGLCRLYKNGDTQLKMAAVCSLLYRERSKLASRFVMLLTVARRMSHTYESYGMTRAKMTHQKCNHGTCTDCNCSSSS